MSLFHTNSGYLKTALLFSLIAFGVHGQTPSASSTPVPSVRLGLGGTGEVNGILVLFDGSVGPDAFFRNLTKQETASPTKFMNGGTEVKFFPGKLIIWLVASGPISAKMKDSEKSKLSNELMGSLKFEAHWKTGMHMRPAKKLTLERVSPPYSANELTAWAYTLTLEDVDVPLTDHLILDVLSPEGKEIARLSAFL